MNGNLLALGAVSALAFGAAARRGSRANTQSYLRGGCYALALALHKDTGAATWGMFDASGAMHHAFVVRADGLAVDARGLRVVDHVGNGSCVENPTFRPVTVVEIANTAFLNNVVGGSPRWRDPDIRESRAFAEKNGLIALAMAGRSRGSAARRQPLDYGALADDFREFYATLGWEVDEERELRRWARSHKITYLGAGAQRAVFGVPGGALKIAFDRDGKDANCREAEVWEDAPTDIRRHLVPVLEHSGMEPGEGPWLLMERVKASARGSLSPEATARLSACGFNDIVGQNISDDGRLLDYGWMYMDEWAPCATPGSYTSNRPAVGGSAVRRPIQKYGSRSAWTLYHGTNQLFDRFDLARAGRRDSGNLGRGIYLSQDPEFAMRYAEANVEKWGGVPTVLRVHASITVVDFSTLRTRLMADTGVTFPPRAQDPERSETLRAWFLQHGIDAAASGSEIVVFDPARLHIEGIEHVPTERERNQALLRRLQRIS